MSNTKSCEVRCTRCRRWFRSQIIQFEDGESFLQSVMYKNTELCPHCNAVVTHDKEMMSVERDSNGKVIKETRYTYDF